MFIENTMKGCVFEKKRKNKNQDKKGIENDISQSLESCFCHLRWDDTGAEWKSRFVNEDFILIFAQLTSYILLVGLIWVAWTRTVDCS